MIEIKVKPISVNEAYTGQRFKTPKYKSFLRECAFLLPNKVKAPEGQFYVIYEFGFSNSLSDYDGGLKNFQDILQQKYNFDDRQILGAYIQKKKVDKGNEYIKFKFFSTDQKDELLKEIKNLL